MREYWIVTAREQNAVIEQVRQSSFVPFITTNYKGRWLGGVVAGRWSAILIRHIGSTDAILIYVGTPDDYS